MIDLKFSTDVANAMRENKPIVALESTIITHGMPYPKNLETAQLVEKTVRDNGATPATIAVIHGQIHIGLEQVELENLSKSKDAMKLSRADLTFALSMGKNGSTTVAATMMCAHLANIKVFATGGIGGVHRGAQDTFDISADLIELAKTPVCVVGAGAKSLLDIAKTLEVLETNGVPVIGYETDQFPAFWSRDSKIACPLRLDSAEDIAKVMKKREDFGDHGGMLIANPVPSASEIPADEMEEHIELAVKKATSLNITGKAVTPFILGEIVKTTGGKSLTTNIALITNNAKLAAKIAIAENALT